MHDQPLPAHFFKLYTGGLSANIFMRDAGLNEGKQRNTFIG
jgi:hypothetical protein